MDFRITTWNLQGRERPDLDDVVDTIAALAPDVVVLQEVQRRQASALAARLGWQHRWWFKHWPVVYPAEGLAVIAPSPLCDLRRVHLAHRWRFWSSRRRIAVLATVGGVRVANVHLGSSVGDGERARQAHVVLGALGPSSPALVAGDCNTKPGSPVIDVFAVAGFADAWAALHPDAPGTTNWRPGPRLTEPTQRLDYVLADPGLEPVEATVAEPSLPDWARFGRISDHVPLTVTLVSTRAWHELTRRPSGP